MIIILFLLIKFYNKIVIKLEDWYDYIYYKIEEKKDFKRHKGMYDYYHDED